MTDDLVARLKIPIGHETNDLNVERREAAARIEALEAEKVVERVAALEAALRNLVYQGTDKCWYTSHHGDTDVTGLVHAALADQKGERKTTTVEALTALILAADRACCRDFGSMVELEAATKAAHAVVGGPPLGVDLPADQRAQQGDPHAD